MKIIVPNGRIEGGRSGLAPQRDESPLSPLPAPPLENTCCNSRQARPVAAEREGFVLGGDGFAFEDEWRPAFKPRRMALLPPAVES
jgi:hypothetical protein